MGRVAVPDTVKRLVDRFDSGRKVFPSGDCKEEQLRPAFPNGPSLTIRHSDFVVRTFLNCPCLAARRSDLASVAPVGQRGAWTYPNPFFTVLGCNMDNALDTIRDRNRGSVPLSVPVCENSRG